MPHPVSFGSQDFLAGSYLAVGAVCFALALAFLTKHVIRFFLLKKYLFFGYIYLFSCSPRSLSSPENLEFIK
jgi:hypothetical protein